MPQTEQPAPGPQIPIFCAICNSPLGDIEIHLHRLWHFDCEKCSYCGGPVNTEVIEKSLNAGHPPAHATCRKTHLFGEFQSKDLLIRLEHIKLLNDEMNSFFPAVDPNHVDIETLYEILKGLKTCAAAVSYALDVTKDKLQIQRSHNFNLELTDKKQAALRAQRAEQANEQTKLEKQEMFAAERENPVLKARRKAIEGLQKACNLSLEAATAMVDGQTRNTGPKPETPIQ